MSTMNRIWNVKNPWQGDHKKVLCVCSAGLLRSPTAAVVLSQPPYNFNTRAVGMVADYALIPLDAVLISWADEIVCMTTDQHEYLVGQTTGNTRVICLNIEDNYEYRNPELMIKIATSYDAAQTLAV